MGGHRCVRGTTSDREGHATKGYTAGHRIAVVQISRNGVEEMMSAGIRDHRAQHEAWNEKEETNSEAFRSDEMGVQVKSRR